MPADQESQVIRSREVPVFPQEREQCCKHFDAFEVGSGILKNRVWATERSGNSLQRPRKFHAGIQWFQRADFSFP